MLFVGAVAVNALAQGTLRRITHWPSLTSNTQPSNWEADTPPLS